ncbi:MAG TPA: radical SAM protein [Acidimicrobiales bacterium]|nr:radical SAM protein [Acidimicrobiales bacterium]
MALEPDLLLSPAPPTVRRIPPLPRRLQVEITGACNLRCRMCLVRYRPRIDKVEGAFPLERFVALLDELPDLEQVTLQGLGEPLLHPDLVAMVEAAKHRRIEVGFNTNGTLLTASRAEALVASGVDWMHVSIDGATAATFEHIRDGARFDRVVRNLRRLLDTRHRLGSTTPRIQLNTVLMRSNVHELADLVRLAADIDVDRLWLQTLSHDFSDTEEDDVAYVEIRRFAQDEALWAGDTDHSGPDGPEGDPPLDEVLAAARRLATRLGLELRLPEDGPPDELTAGHDSTLPCDWPWTSAYVTHDGKVQPCCMVMGDDRAVIGDIADGGFAEVWRSGAYHRFRQQLLSDRPPAVCRGCSLYRHVF